MGWGAAIGMGEAIQGIGKGMQDDLKQQRINEWKSEESAADRQFRKSQDQLKIDADNARAENKQKFEAEQGRLDRGSREKIADENAKARAEADEKDRQNRLDVANIRSASGLLEGGDDYQVNPQDRAEAYADKMIDEKASYLSTDKQDFRQWGGSREQARQFYIQEYLNRNGGRANPLDALKGKFGER